MAITGTPLRRCVPAAMLDSLEHSATTSTTLPLSVIEAPPTGFVLLNLGPTAEDPFGLRPETWGEFEVHASPADEERCTWLDARCTSHYPGKSITAGLAHAERCGVTVNAYATRDLALAARPAGSTQLVALVSFEQGAVMVGSDLGAIDDEDEAALEVHAWRGARAKVLKVEIPGVCHCGKTPTKIDLPAELPAAVRYAIKDGWDTTHSYITVCDKCASPTAITPAALSAKLGADVVFDSELSCTPAPIAMCHKHTEGLVRSTKFALPLVVLGVVFASLLIAAIPVWMFWYADHSFDTQYHSLPMKVVSTASRECGQSKCRVAYNVEYHGPEGDFETVYVGAVSKKDPTPSELPLVYDTESKILYDSVSNDSVWYLFGAITGILGLIAIFALASIAIESQSVDEMRKRFARHWMKRHSPAATAATPPAGDEEEVSSSTPPVWLDDD